MNKNNDLIAEIYEKWAEHIEHMNEDQANEFVINALANMALKERDMATHYKMELKRFRLMHE